MIEAQPIDLYICLFAVCVAGIVIGWVCCLAWPKIKGKQELDESHEMIVKLLSGGRLANYCDEDLLEILRSPHVSAALYNIVFKMLFDRHES